MYNISKQIKLWITEPYCLLMLLLISETKFVLCEIEINIIWWFDS